MTTIINHLDDKFLFGKFQGEALGDVLMYAPDYLTWVIKNVDGNRFVLMDSAVEEIKEIFPKFTIDEEFETYRQRQLNDYYGRSDNEYDYCIEDSGGTTLKEVLIADGCLGGMASNSCDLMVFLETRSKKIFDVCIRPWPYHKYWIEELLGEKIEVSNRVFWRTIGYLNLDDLNKERTNGFGEIRHYENEFRVNRALGLREISMCSSFTTICDLERGITIGRLPIYREICLCKESFTIDAVQLIMPQLDSNRLYRKIKREGVNYIVSETEWLQDNWPTEYSLENGKIILRVDENSLLFKDKYGYIKSVGKDAVVILGLSELYNDEEVDMAYYQFSINDLDHVYLSNISISRYYKLEED